VREAGGRPRYTSADAYRTATSVLMVVIGIVILARMLRSGIHVHACLVGLGFTGLGAYRLSFVAAYLRSLHRRPQ
jgi:hypothetical protein